MNKEKFIAYLENEIKEWEKGKKAKAFKKDEAEGLVWGLSMNFHPAFIITLPDFYEPINDEDDNEKGGEA